MPARHLPVCPDLAFLRREAKDLLAAMRHGDAAALADLHAFHPGPVDATRLQLSDAQLTLARSYQVPSWPRLVHACQLVEAIWSDDIETVRALVTRHPRLLVEEALVRPGNWGPPLTYAANLGRDDIIRMLYSLGARDLGTAMDRAALQGQVETATMLYELAGRPPVPEGALGGPAYTLSSEGTALLFALGARVRNDVGERLAPVDVVLETDSRKPDDKHRILEMYAAHGLQLPDTPTMALHRGRIDLLAAHCERDPGLLARTFTHEEIYPPDLGCHDEIHATQGTPLAGTTLLHMCVDYDEYEIARWLLERGMSADASATVDADGFGGHTPLFATVVSQPAFWMNYGRRGNFASVPDAVRTQEARFATLLLDHGANPNARASIRKQLHPGYGEDEVMREFRNVTPRTWGERYHRKVFVNQAALSVIVERGGAD